MLSCDAPSVPENMMGVVTVKVTPALLAPPANFYFDVEKDGMRVCTCSCYDSNCTTDYLADGYALGIDLVSGEVNITFGSARPSNQGQYDVQVFNNMSYTTKCKFTLKAGNDDDDQKGCSDAGWIVAAVFVLICLVLLVVVLHLKKDKIGRVLHNVFGRNNDHQGHAGHY
ncbi:uncharacterized protein [Littorina saxatilis]|uniref:Uncharacterized protein n=1 Tax=Littorina saxatilis TaxID=31220 RepID=A0AAN9BWV6_9CAEN